MDLGRDDTFRAGTGASAGGGPAPSTLGFDLDLDHLETVISEAADSLRAKQFEDGKWEFELEADVTIPSEYIMLEHFLDDIDETVQAKLASYIRNRQSEVHGGWPLFYGGDLDISATVKAYYALKLTGDDQDAPHMVRAREAILAAGGAERANVFTRYALALFGQVPWRAVPVMPVELLLMPKWFPFNVWRMAYWSRTVIAPLLVLATLKPRARNPKEVHVPELFQNPPEEVKDYLHNPTGSTWGELFLLTDKCLRLAEPLFPGPIRKAAINQATRFITDRLNGEDGLGGIFPAMANTVMAFDAIGIDRDDPRYRIAREALKKLLVLEEDEGYCQPCLSPVWDTALTGLSLMEASQGEEVNTPEFQKAVDWLLDRQILDVKGDWAIKNPDLRPGGWAFEDRNDYYPDTDDTAVVGVMLDRLGTEDGEKAAARAEEWILGMQSENGGWGAFDIDNTHYYLNHIPFADHGALLDPPTEDVTARCLSFLAQRGRDKTDPAVAKGIEYLKSVQEKDGSWFGRWGTNYIYGTWSVMAALNAVGEDMSQEYVQRAVDWLKVGQRPDGGWGEDGATYWQERRAEAKESTASQTSWALLALMAAGEVDTEVVAKGVKYLTDAPRDGSEWHEPWFTAVGFPRVFYLRYHGYNQFFPLWALSRYRNLMRGNSRSVPHTI